MISSTTDGTRRPGARPRMSGASRATTEIASRLTNSTSGIEGSSHGRASTADVTEYGDQEGSCFPGEGLQGDRAGSRRRLRHVRRSRGHVLMLHDGVVPGREAGSFPVRYVTRSTACRVAWGIGSG